MRLYYYLKKIFKLWSERISLSFVLALFYIIIYIRFSFYYIILSYSYIILHEGFTESEYKSLAAVSKLVMKNGGIFRFNLEEVAEYLNNN